MKKKVLLIVILLSCLVVSGCTADYEININKDLSVSEVVSITTPSSDLVEFTNYETYSEVVNGIYESTDYYLNEKSKFSEIIKSNIVGGTITTKFENLESFINESQALHEVFENTSIEIGDNKVSFLINDYVPISDTTSTRNPIDEINITIKSPYRIDGLKNSNCNIKNDIFICKLKITQKDEINNMNFILNKTINTTKSMFIYLIGAIIVIILFTGTIYLKSLKANKI